MKSIFYLLFFGLIVISLGNSAGAGLIQNRDFTGSPLSTGTCSICHSGGTFKPDVGIQLLDAGFPITSYVPGQTYTLHLTIEATGFPFGFGFQLVSLNADDENGGTFGTAPSDTRLVNVNGRRYFEQSRRVGVNVFDIDWTAPRAGSGDISFFAVGNAVNANGNSSGDEAGTETLTFAEDLNSAIHSQEELSRRITAFPNPTQSEVVFESRDSEMQIHKIELLNNQGRVVAKFEGAIADLSLFTSGMYIALIHTGEGIVSKLITKQ